MLFEDEVAGTSMVRRAKRTTRAQDDVEIIVGFHLYENVFG